MVVVASWSSLVDASVSAEVYFTRSRRLLPRGSTKTARVDTYTQVQCSPSPPTLNRAQLVPDTTSINKNTGELVNGLC